MMYLSVGPTPETIERLENLFKLSPVALVEPAELRLIISEGEVPEGEDISSFQFSNETYLVQPLRIVPYHDAAVGYYKLIMTCDCPALVDRAAVTGTGKGLFPLIVLSHSFGMTRRVTAYLHSIEEIVARRESPFTFQGEDLREVSQPYLGPRTPDDLGYLFG